MHPSQILAAQERLKTAPWPASCTHKAIALLEQNPSEDDLMHTFDQPSSAPIALEALCALRLESNLLYSSVCQSIACHPRLSWCLVDSLNRLAWYDGMRAYFQSTTTLHGCCSLPFYILARNKIFTPADMCGEVYAYHVKGFQALVTTARTRQWQQMQPDELAVINMMYTHLDQSRPDVFVVYFSTLLLGSFAPLNTSILRLKTLIQEQPHPALTGITTLALKHVSDDSIW